MEKEKQPAGRWTLNEAKRPGMHEQQNGVDRGHACNTTQKQQQHSLE
jgi:hypothetical protein